jgi:hypothetical protein
MPNFIPATGRTQHVAAVCLNRIGKVHSYPGGCPGREIRILIIGQALYAGQNWSEFGRCNLPLDGLEGEAKTMLPAKIG